MEIKHYAQCIRRDIVEYANQWQIITWDDGDDTVDRFLSTDKIWSSYGWTFRSTFANGYEKKM